MLEFVQAKMRTIEQEFGAKFLEYNAPHPVRDHWRAARRFLDRVGPGQRDLRNKDLAFVLEIAAAIESTRGCPNFDLEVRKRLHKHQHFEGACYEMLLASKFLPHCDVEFMRSHGKGGRPGDIKLSRGGRSILVECTKKKLVTKPLSDADRAGLSDVRDRVLEAARGGAEISITVLGTDLGNIRDVLGDVEQIVASGRVGSFPIPRGAWVSITDTTPSTFVDTSERGKVGLRMPTGLDVGTARVMVRFGENGEVETAEPRKLEVRVLDSHPFQSIVDSFKARLGKFGRGEAGVISMGLDVSRVSEDQRWTYLAFAARLLSQLAWSEGKNARIAALILTAPTYNLQESDGWRVIFNYINIFCKNRTADFMSEWLPAPGAARLLPAGTDVFA